MGAPLSRHLRTLINRYTVASIALLVVQQAIVASSTLWIAILGRNLVEGGPIFVPFILFVASLTTVYVPAILSLMFLDAAKVSSLGSCVEAFSIQNRGNTAAWPDQRQRESTDVSLTAETHLVIDDAMGSSYDLLALILNVALNVMVLGFVLTPWFVLAYVAGVASSFLILHRLRRRVRDASREAQRDRVHLNSVLARAWDNVLLGNVRHIDMWLDAEQHALEKFRHSAVTATGVREGVAAATTIGLFIAVLGLMGLEFHQHVRDVGYLAVLAVTLPRQIQILQYAAAIASQITNLSAALPRLTELLLALDRRAEAELDGRIHWSRLRFEFDGAPISTSNLSHLLTRLRERTNGRITIRGPNGSGKTSVLLAVKRALGDDACLIPEAHHLDVGTATAGSTGEQALSALGTLQNDGSCRYLLLDEWDANLDDRNLRAAEDVLDALSQRAVVIESRHR